MIFFDCLGLDGEEDDFDNSGDDCPFTSKVEKDWEDITEEAEEQGWYAEGNIDLVRRGVSCSLLLNEESFSYKVKSFLGPKNPLKSLTFANFAKFPETHPTPGRRRRLHRRGRDRRLPVPLPGDHGGERGRGHEGLLRHRGRGGSGPGGGTMLDGERGHRQVRKKRFPTNCVYFLNCYVFKKIKKGQNAKT